MSKRKGNLFEQYVDKLVLAVTGILSLALLWMFVLSNPQAVEYNRKKYSPGELDAAIKADADRLKQDRLDAPPMPVLDPLPIKGPFDDLVANPIGDIDFAPPLPGVGEKIAEEKRIYALPEIPAITQPMAKLIRTVAYIPTEPVTQSLPYDKVQIELGDIDFVTVQASIDAATLYKNFEMSFANQRTVKPEWRDPRYAKPVFARVNIERRKQDSMGNWGQWQEVGATKIDHLAKVLDVPEKVTELPLGTVDVTMQQFSQFPIYSHLLQPEPYDFASSREREKWLCPSLYVTYVEKLEREEGEKAREAREKEIQERERERDSRRPTGTRRAAGRTGTGGGAEDLYGAGGYGQDTRRTRTGTGRVDDRRNPDGRRTAGGQAGMYDEYGYEGIPGRPKSEKDKDSKDILIDMASIWLNKDQDLGALKEPLIFWAHDDSLDNGGIYQYRMRIGLFNPIAGHDWFRASEQQFKDEVILWSAYSEPTEPVQVDKMIHFFPLTVSSAESKSVDVQVSKYHLGSWRSENFSVRSGEPIGSVVEKEQEKSRVPGGMGNYDGYAGDYSMGMGGAVNRGPEKIDFNTGAVMVDVVAATKWMGVGPSLKERQISDFLYTIDGMGIEHFPVRSQYWDSDVKTKYKEIEDCAKEEPIKYQPRGSRSSTKKALPGGGGRYDIMNPYGNVDGSRGVPSDIRRLR